MNQETKYEFKGTPGPWRFEVHERAKHIKLCGGVPKYDLTVMDCVRWGMQGGQVRFREPEKDGFNIMHETIHWSVVIKGREHHASWFKGIEHPDAQLIEASPLLLSALIKAVEYEGYDQSVVAYENDVPDWYREAKSAIEAALNLKTESVQP